MKKWQKTAMVETVPNTGILKINVFHPDQKEAQKISQAISSIINNERHLFFGDNQEIDILTLGKTIVSNKTVKPNAIANTFFGLIAGLLISASLIFLFPDKDPHNIKKDSLSLMATPRRKKQIIKGQMQNTTLGKKASAPANLPII
jgi:capsular polysaccharide biosynthesis protein